MPILDAAVVGVAGSAFDAGVAGVVAAGAADAGAAALAGTAADVIGSDWAAGTIGAMGADGAGSIGATGGVWGDVGADTIGSDWAAGNAGSMTSNTGGIVGSQSPQWLNWINQYKTPLTMGGDLLKGIGGGINSAQNRQTQLQIAQMQAQAPLNTFMGERAAVSSSIPKGNLPIQSVPGAVLTRPDGTPVYIKGTGIVGQANGSA